MKTVVFVVLESDGKFLLERRGNHLGFPYYVRDFGEEDLTIVWRTLACRYLLRRSGIFQTVNVPNDAHRHQFEFGGQKIQARFIIVPNPEGTLNANGKLVFVSPELPQVDIFVAFIRTLNHHYAEAAIPA